MVADKPRPPSVEGLDYFVHPQGLADSPNIGAGTRIWAFSHVLVGAVVGRDCNIGECVFIENGVVLGDRCTIKNGVQLWTGVMCEEEVFVGPNATFTNDIRPRVGQELGTEDFAPTYICRGASIGANATVVAGTRIGEHAMVGAGTVVIRDVPAHALVVGNPARWVGWVCVCGETVSKEAWFVDERPCSSCDRHYRFVNPGEGLARVEG